MAQSPDLSLTEMLWWDLQMAEATMMWAVVVQKWLLQFITELLNCGAYLLSCVYVIYLLVVLISLLS